MLAGVCTLDDLKGKFEETMNKAGERVRAGMEELNKSFSQAAPQLQHDADEIIQYLNDEVVPAVRTRSAEAMRLASEKLRQLAEQFDRK